MDSILYTVSRQILMYRIAGKFGEEFNLGIGEEY